MTAPVDPGIREINPDDEAARLAEARKPWKRAGEWVFQLPSAPAGWTVAAHVTLDLGDDRPVPADLADKLRDFLQEHLPAGES